MYLTKNEIEIMDVLWKEGRPLSRGEILSLSEEKSWMDLLSYDVVEFVGYEPEPDIEA